MSRQYHIALARGEVGRYVLLTGDVAGCEHVAARFDDSRRMSENRQFVTYTGSLDGERVSVMSTGIGSPSTAIAVEELATIGADTLIRIGTASATQNYLRSGALVVAQAAVRDEGTTPRYVPLSYPAVADAVVQESLRRSATRAGAGAHSGIVRTTDTPYADVSPHTMPAQALWKGTPDNVWAQGNVLCADMEAAALFVVASVRGLRAGCLLSIVNDTCSGDSGADLSSSSGTLADVAVDALRILIRHDRGG